jgi:hypothetical protein
MNNSSQLHTSVKAGFPCDKSAELRTMIKGTCIREEGIIQSVAFNITHFENRITHLLFTAINTIEHG